MEVGETPGGSVGVGVPPPPGVGVGLLPPPRVGVGVLPLMGVEVGVAFPEEQFATDGFCDIMIGGTVFVRHVMGPISPGLSP